MNPLYLTEGGNVHARAAAGVVFTLNGNGGQQDASYRRRRFAHWPAPAKGWGGRAPAGSCSAPSLYRARGSPCGGAAEASCRCDGGSTCQTKRAPETGLNTAIRPSGCIRSVHSPGWNATWPSLLPSYRTNVHAMRLLTTSSQRQRQSRLLRQEPCFATVSRRLTMGLPSLLGNVIMLRFSRFNHNL